MFRSASYTGGELELEDVSDLITCCEDTVHVIFVVSCGDAETSAGRDEWSSGVSDNDDGDLAAEHFVGEGWHLGRVVQNDGDDGRVVMTVHNEPETFQSQAEVSRIEGNTLETLFTLSGTISPLIILRALRICMRTGGVGDSP